MLLIHAAISMFPTQIIIIRTAQIYWLHFSHPQMNTTMVVGIEGAIR